MKRRVLSFIITLALCLNLCPVWVLAVDEGTGGGLCAHHPAHTDECGYSSEDPGAPCTFVCQICPIEDLIGKLPASVSADNIEQAQAQLSEIYDLCDGLTDDELQQLDLSLCVSLLAQIDGMEAEVQSDTSSDSSLPPKRWVLEGNQSFDAPHEILTPYEIDTNGYTLTGSNSTTIRVTKNGTLDLKGTVVSKKGAGVEVSGSLNITEQADIQGQTYALDVASGATVQLSTGRYFGKGAAIHQEDGNFAALLAPGCAYFDEDGNPLLPSDIAAARTVIVKQCTGHSKTFVHNEGFPTHAWTCSYCGTEEKEEKCTFSFEGNGTGTCDFCGSTLSIAVDEGDLIDLVYDGTIKPENIDITVTLTDGTNKVLVKGTDYRAEYEPRKDAGEITVTVTGITFNGTFSKIYYVTQAQPGIRWDATAKAIDYDGRRATIEDELPDITITLNPDNNEDLHQYLQYSYRNAGDTEFTDGLPFDAGVYEIKAYIPESQNYEAAETDPLLTLTIKAIDPVTDAPVAAKPTYNGAAQALVTAGAVDSRATGAEILFATSENGTYSTTIPTGTNADDYEVWYKVEGTGNYNAVAPTKIDDVEILRKQITPVVELSEYKYLYDGGYKEPKVTVKDEDHSTVLPDTEYQVEYQNNRNVGMAEVIVTDKPGGNYDITRAEVKFEITNRTQNALSITGQPNTVIYGDQFVLGTSGGSGNGKVTWQITEGSDAAIVGQASGQVTITGHGEVTVQATKSGSDPVTSVVNYEDATASWTFTADPKPVTATVTAEDKDYDGSADAAIHAVVEQGIMPGDEITITGLTGAFSDANAGADKTVTVSGTPAVSGKNSQHYNISYSSFTVKATIHKAVAKITTPPKPATPTYNGTEQALITTGAVVNPTGVGVEYALSEDGAYSTDFPKATNAGTYTVWYRVKETDNYTGLAPKSVTAKIDKKPVSPEIGLDQSTFVYDGTAKEPVVTLYEADGTTVIPTGEYTVAYSGNIDVGSATVTVTAKAGGNYSFTPDPVTKTFTIGKKQAQVVTAPEAAGLPLTFNTFVQRLVTAGKASGGTMVYSVDGENGTYSADIPTKTDAGEYTVHYKVSGDANHSDSDVGQVTVTIAPKTVKDPTIELFDGANPLVSYTYDGSAKEPAVVVKDGSTTIGAGEYNIVYSDNTDAGKGTVNITDKPNGNYTVTGSATFVILKADIKFTKDPADAGATYDGKAHELLTPGETSGGEVLYALNSQTGTYTAAIPTATNAGNYTVYYKVVGDKNHNDFAAKPVNATILRKPLTTITIELTPDSFEYDGTAKLPEVTVKDGKTVLPEEEYTWSCDAASPVNVGSYTITIDDAVNGNYDLTGVSAKTASFTIGRIPQKALVIEKKPLATNYGDSFQLTVSGGSGDGAVSWSNTGPATVDSDGNVTITGVGEVTITVKKEADTNYNAAQAQWTFTAAPKAVTASVTVNGKAYDGTTDATVASAGIDSGDLVNGGDQVTIAPASITAEFDTASAGTGKTVTLDTSKVEVTGADAAKYDISYPGTVTADIAQVTAAITTPPAGTTLTYNGQPQELVTAGETNVGFIVYSLDGINFSPEIPTGTDAKTYTVYYKVDGTADYTGVSVDTPISVTIAPKPITPKVELSESSYLYDGTKKEPKITVKDGNTVLDEEQYTVVWGSDLTSAGTHTATISQVSGKNYAFSDVTAQVEITKATQAALNITGQPAHVYYGDTVTTLDTTGGSGNGTVTWTIEEGGANSSIDPGGKLTVKDTGSITVKAERTVPNYGTVSDTWTFTVEPKPVMAEVTVTGKVYDGTTDVDDADIKAEVKANDLVDPADSIEIKGLKGAYDNANAGTNKTVALDDANISIVTDRAKYTVVYPATAKADITPRQVNVTVTLSGSDLQTDANGDDYYIYDGTEKKPAVAVTGADGAYSAVLAASDYTVSYSGNKNVGTAAVTVTAKAGGNYTFDDETANFFIRSTGAVLTSTPQAKDLTYDGTAQDLVTVGNATGGHVEYSLDGSTYSSSIPTKINAGVYTVYYMVKGDANHDDTAPGQVSVTIKPKEITPAITLSQASYEYDGNAKTPGVTVKDGADTIDSGEYTVSYRDNVNAGTATAVVSDNNGGNYIVNGTATFEITKAAPTFKAPKGKTGLRYNGELQDLVNAGVCNEGTVVYSLNSGNYSAAIPVAAAVGTYTIDYKVLGDANHSDTVSGQLTVSIAKNTVTNPTISLSADTFKYNGSQQKPTITVYDDSGNVIPEREYTVTITGNNGNNMVDVDTYTITVTTADSSNYVISSSNTRTYKIVEAEQETISITGTKAQVFYGDTIQLGTSGGTGSETITWTVTANDGSTVNSKIGTTGLLTVKDVGGPFTVTVKRSAGGNYKDVSATWEFSAAKKQVTAVVTADDRPYAAGDKSVKVHASVPGSELVSGDSITINDVTGTFDDPNAGTNKKVTVDSSKAAVSGINAGNYEITYPAATTASILAEAATVDTAPGDVTPSLTYDASQAQELVTAGAVTGGTMVYSLDGSNFTPAIPKAKDAGTYTVYFKAQGDGNHTDSAVGTKSVTIAQQSVTPQIELTPPGAQYDGQVKRPEVTVRDSANNVIPAGEYTVVYDSSTNWKSVGNHKVTVQNVTGGNYIITKTDETFTISTTPQNPLEIVNKPGLVHYGDTFTLSATGGSGSGPITWSVDDAGAGVVKIDANGFVEIIGTGSAEIKATKTGGTDYDTVEATYPLNALKKPITAIVTADDKVYDGNTTATIHVTWKDGDLEKGDTINTGTLSGTFADDSVGTNKTVTISGGPISSDKYDITIPSTTTASILKADAAAPNVTANDRAYDGTAQSLVTGGSANTAYSDARDGVYSAVVPTGTNAGTYTVWYKEKGDANHNDSAPQSVTVTISRKTLTLTSADITLSGNDLQDDGSGNYSYVYDGTEKKPTVTIVDGAAVVPASEYTATYSDNKNVGTATVTITSNAGGNYTFAEQTVKFAITRASAQLTSSPQAKDLTYTGQPQELVTVGVVSGGHIEYLQSDGSYGRSIPAETNAGTYTVTYKVVGDGNYADSADTWTVSVTIKPKEIVSPKVTVAGTYTYDGSPKEPEDAKIKVEDGTTIIPASEYTVAFRDNVEAGTATVIVTNANGGNYIVNGTGAFTIGKASAAVKTAPDGNTNLPYNGAAQELVTAGSASGGTMVYALSQTGEYSPAIPAQTAVGSYTVWYKVQGDSNHNDTTPASVSASIIVNNVANPTVQVAPETVKYNGTKQEPAVTVIDDYGVTIDGSEYTVTYADADGNPVANLTSVGKYTLTITGTNANYTFTATATFEILPADQTPLTITGTRERVYYGDTIQLGTTGGSGTVTWKVDDSSTAATIDGSGLLTITGVGSVTVTATSSAAGYADQTATWPLYADKKPVTAVVTAAAKTYDGDTAATVTAALQSSDLVNGDTVKITLSGSFEDPNAGTDKKVTVDSTNPDFAGSTGNYENYNITYPATTTASILKADVTNVTAPTAETDLEYTGIAQTLVTAGDVTGGTMEYSLDNRTYSASLPTGTDAGGYDIWYRVKGDGNHNDTAGTKLSSQVTIAQQTVDAPIIEFTPSSASYDGAIHKPAVTVKDKNHRVIPAEEYTITYGSTDWKTAGDHEVTIAGKTGGNYNITTKTEKFTISQMGQNPLSIVNQPGRVQYGDTFTLSTSGGSGTGAVTWDSTDKTVATISDNGLVKVLKSGAATITATKQADGNYGATTVEWSFSAEKKPVTAIVTADDKVYDGSNSATIHVAWKDGDLLSGDTINLETALTGTFNNASAGNNKTVTITGAVPDSDKYAVTYNNTTTASITPKAASVSGSTATELTYNGSEQVLVSGVTAADGTLAYSRDGSYYTLLAPKETNAGTYAVWYKAQASGNYTDSPAVRVDVTIKPKTVTNPVIDLSSETFDYDGTAKKPDVVVKDGSTVIPAGEYTVSYSDNTAVGTAKVTISDNAGGNYTVSGSKTFIIQAGEAVLKDAPKANNLTYNGFAQELVTEGTAVNGHVEYSRDGTTYSTSIPQEINAGTYSVHYKVVGDNGASDTAARVVYVTIQPKQVTPVIRLENRSSYSVPYNGNLQEPDVTVYVENKLYSALLYDVSYSNNINVGTAEVTVQSMGGNYQFLEFKTFTITKGKAEFLTEPKARTNLVYNGTAQKLVNPGYAKNNNGTVLYSLDNYAYSAAIPTAINRDSYTVFAKVSGNSNYEESDVAIISVEIGVNTVQSPTVTLSASSFPYTGSEQKPTVTVIDDGGNVISADEYTVTYLDNVNVGTARISIKSKAAGNYSFTATAEFQIVDASQTPLDITGKRDDVYYGDTLSLGTTGGGSGAVTWSSSNTAVADIDSNGTVKIKTSGSVTIMATKGSCTDSWPFYAKAKPVTAVVTAADKPYDGNNTAALTVTISSGLLPGDSISSGEVTASGYFTNTDAGANKTVIITGLTVPEAISAKYDISCLATTTASITQAAARVTAAPTKAENLTYTGSPLDLLASGGTADGGNLAYSVDGGRSYSFDIPTGTDAGSYTVWCKAVASDENHKDSAPVKMDAVTIAANTDRPTVLCTPGTFQYDGTEKTPTVVVRDSANRIIPESEYTVTLPADRIAVDTYTVTVTDNPGGNYKFDTSVTGTFNIVTASQNPLSIVTDKPTDIYYGDTFRLTAMGGSGSGAIQWSIKEGDSFATIGSVNGNNCVVTVTGTGGFTVEAYRKGADGYSDSNTDSVPFVANPKPVTPVVTAENKLYDGTTDAKLKATWKSGDLMNSDTINLDAVLTGTFDSATVGTNKRVTFTVPAGLSGTYGNYYITWPDSTTASIDKVDAKLDDKPAASVLTYTGSEQELVTPGSTVDNIGTIEYSLSQNGAYSADIPTAKDAGKYTVWYKVADSVNYTGIAAASIEVEIAKATPTISTKPTASTGTEGQSLKDITFSNGGAASVGGRFTWKDDSIKPEVGKSQQYVLFTPDDTANYNAVEFQIGVTIQQASGSGGTGSTNNASMQTTVRNGTANTVLSSAAGSRLVREAAANQSQNILIKPEITSDVTRTQVSIPASTVSQIKDKTEASLTVSAPIADVTIPNAALDTLSSAGGTVKVATEQVDQGVMLTLTAGGEKVEDVPGGVTLSVPAEDAGPGTVAVLVHDDGTRETLRKSVVEDGKVNIPLNGSATVEIVDNSKNFTDVPPTDWAADAVAFASARELFSGTSETTFSPDQSMSRGMLTTVLYNLEGRPEQDLTMQDLTGGYSDVSSDAWYASSVAWASEKGIVSGYGNGQFSPDGSVTREQFAVMLWRYAGSPKASSQALSFTDVDQASSYAQEALCWAVEKGILNGYTDGRLAPGGTATRAEAAQMLKNFMENT